MGRGVGELQKCIDVEDCVGDLSFGHESSLVRVDEGIGKIDVLESLGHNGGEDFEVCIGESDWAEVCDYRLILVLFRNQDCMRVFPGGWCVLS